MAVQRTEALFSEGETEEDKGETLQVALREVSLQCKKEFFYGEYYNLLEQLPQGHGRLLIVGCF